jgi:hypothetical protein
MLFLSIDFEQVSAPAGLAAGGTSQAEAIIPEKEELNRSRIASNKM